MKLYIKTYRGMVLIRPVASATIGSIKVLLAQQLLTSGKLNLAHRHNGTEIILEDQHTLEYYGVQSRTCFVLIPDEKLRRASESQAEFAQNFHKARRRGTTDLISETISYKDMFFEAVMTGNIEYVRLCARDSPKFLTMYSEKGWNPLQLASYFNQERVVRFLLNCPSTDINALSEDSHFTALHLACLQGNYDSVKVLISAHNVDIDFFWESYGTPLHCAAISGNSALVEMMLLYLANPRIVDSQGKTPLDLNVSADIRQMLYKQVWEPDEAPAVFDSMLCAPGFITDDIFWAQLLPMDGTLKLYHDKSDFALDILPRQTIELFDINEAKKTNVKTSTLGKKYFFDIFMNSGKRHVFYTLSEHLTVTWVERIFLSLVYQKTERQKMSAPIKPQTEDDDEQCETTEGFQTTAIKSNYEILDQIGNGSFSKVMLAKSDLDDQLYALKCLSKEHLKNHGQLKYAVNECSILREIDFPFIIKLHDSFETMKSLWIVLEYCPGGTLEQLLKKATYLDTKAAAFYTAQIVLAIEQVHNHNVIYRDLKPENIMIDKDGQLKLTDFGLATQNNDMARSFCGTPAYLSPEMVRRKGITKEADIYGIGTVLYEMLTGYPPYYSDKIGELFQRIKYSALKFPHYVEEAAKDLLEKLLQRDPMERLTIEEIKQHQLFAEIEWDQLKNREIQPDQV